MRRRRLQRQQLFNNHAAEDLAEKAVLSIQPRLENLRRLREFNQTMRNPITEKRIRQEEIDLNKILDILQRQYGVDILQVQAQIGTDLLKGQLLKEKSEAIKRTANQEDTDLLDLVDEDRYLLTQLTKKDYENKLKDDKRIPLEERLIPQGSELVRKGQATDIEARENIEGAQEMDQKLARQANAKNELKDRIAQALLGKARNTKYNREFANVREEMKVAHSVPRDEVIAQDEFKMEIADQRKAQMEEARRQKAAEQEQKRKQVLERKKYLVAKETAQEQVQEMAENTTSKMFNQILNNVEREDFIDQEVEELKQQVEEEKGQSMQPEFSTARRPVEEGEADESQTTQKPSQAGKSPSKEALQQLNDNLSGIYGSKFNLKKAYEDEEAIEVPEKLTVPSEVSFLKAMQEIETSPLEKEVKITLQQYLYNHRQASNKKPEEKDLEKFEKKLEAILKKAREGGGARGRPRKIVGVETLPKKEKRVKSQIKKSQQ